MDSKTKNRKSREEIEAMAGRAFAGLGPAAGDGAIVELKQGWFNAAYVVRLADGREVVLKIAPPAGAEIMQYERNIMATEVAAMQLVRQNPAIPVPEIYFYDDTHDLCDAAYFFMAKVEGENLAHVKADLPEETQASLERQIGAIIREVNTFTGSYFGHEGNPALRADTWKEAFSKIVEAALEDAAAKHVAFAYSYDALRAAIHKHASALNEITTPCLVHWDAWDPNFFVKDGQISGIIDFERALWAEPLLEAQFRQPFGSSTAALRGYGKDTFTYAEQQRNYLYSLYLGLVMHIECFYRNYETDDVFNFSRQYIATQMAWLQANDASSNAT